MKDEPDTRPAPKRADAQRSTEAILQAAREVFAMSGVDAPVREIAAKAGVGIGTLYRNFPTRADLIEAVFRREIDDCADAAQMLGKQHPPFEALSLWVDRYVTFLATKRGFASALYSGDPAYASLPGHVRKRFDPAIQTLLDAAAAAGEVKTEIKPMDLLRAVGRLSAEADGENAVSAHEMVRLLLNGLRYG